MLLGIKDPTKILLLKPRQTGSTLAMTEIMREIMQMKFNQAMMWGADSMLVKKKRVRRKMKKHGA